MKAKNKKSASRPASPALPTERKGETRVASQTEAPEQDQRHLYGKPPRDLKAWNKEMRARIKHEGLQTYFGKGRFKVYAVLKDEDRGPFAMLLRTPCLTAKRAHEWLTERGYKVGIECVKTHLRDFRLRLDKAREAAELAYMFAQAAREFGAAATTDASAAHVEQRMMESLFKLVSAQNTGPFDSKTWIEVHKAIGEQTKNRGTIEAIRADLDERMRRAVESAEKAARQGSSGKVIAAKVREMLGLPPRSAPGGRPMLPPMEIPAPAATAELSGGVAKRYAGQTDDNV